MKKWKQLVAAFAVIAGVSVVALAPGNALAINVFKGCNGSATQVCASTGESATNMAQDITSTLLFILGIIAVIMIIVGGIRYTTSNGDASRVKAAKDTITYSVVGLVVAILAWSIVTFVVGRFN